MMPNQWIQLIPLALVLYVVFALFIWPIIDVLRNEFTGYNKIVWLLAIVFIPFLGGLLYLIMGGKQKILSQKDGE